MQDDSMAELRRDLLKTTDKLFVHLCAEAFGNLQRSGALEKENVQQQIDSVVRSVHLTALIAAGHWIDLRAVVEDQFDRNMAQMLDNQCEDSEE
jgi:hypothetical protein